MERIRGCGWTGRIYGSVIVVEPVEGKERVNGAHDQQTKNQNEGIISASRETDSTGYIPNETKVIIMEFCARAKQLARSECWCGVRTKYASLPSVRVAVAMEHDLV